MISYGPRIEFENWLSETFGLNGTWCAEQNSYKEFACHLAWLAWAASGLGTRLAVSGTNADLRAGVPFSALSQSATGKNLVQECEALPTWAQCESRVTANVANALERFICRFEPAGVENAQHAKDFRTALSALLGLPMRGTETEKARVEPLNWA